jgi:shikimate kinase
MIETCLRQTCLLIYLEISAETAWKRIQATAAAVGGALPPFLNTADPRETHYQLHTRRARAYRESADFTIEAENKTADTISKEVISLLETGCEEWKKRN